MLTFLGLERLGSATARSRSRSVSGTPAPRSAKKPGTPRQRRGRSRKVVESSPPPSDNRRTNIQPAYLPPDDLLEIGESQPSQVNGDLQELPDSCTASPLFVTDYSAADDADQRSMNVALPPPPSSWREGAYEPFSASQVPTSDPPVASQPEPSQYVPDPADTTGTTEDTTETSAVQTTPSQPTRSVPVNFGETPRPVVDSQSLPGSSSYIPSAEKSSTSRSDSATVESIDTSSARPQPNSEEAQQDSEEQYAQPGAERSQTRLSSLDVAATSDDQPGTLVVSSDQSLPISEGRVEIENQVDGSAEKTNTRPSTEDPQPSPKDSQPATNSSTHTTGAVDSPSALHEQVESAREESGNPRTQPPSPQESGGALEQQKESNLTWNFSALDAPPQNTSNSPIVPISAQPEPTIQSSSTESATEDTRQEPQASELAQSSARPEIADAQNIGTNDRVEYSGPAAVEASQGSTTEDEEPSGAVDLQLGGNLIDLTSSTRDPEVSLAFSITPPKRLVKSFDQSILGQQYPGSSDYFPFQTQLPRSETSNTILLSFNLRTSHTEVLPQTSNHTDDSFDGLGQSRNDQAIQPSVERSSSPLPNPPSQSIETGVFGESAPPRPEAPCTPIQPAKMDGSQPPPSSESLKARLKAMRARHRVSQESIPKSTPASQPAAPLQNQETQPSHGVTATPAVPVINREAPTPIAALRLASPLLLARDGWRSPSAVPHLEPLPIITQEEMNTSARYETLLPQAQSHGNEDQRNGSLTSTGTPSNLHNGQNSETADLHTIPIAIVGSQKDHYSSTVYYYRKAIQRFLKDDNPDAALVDELKDFVERMRRITMHLDLDNSETVTQYEVDATHQADWDVKCSAKFRFLKDLFLPLQDKDLTIAIVAQPGKIVNMLGTFLEGKDIPYRRLGTDPPKSLEEQGITKALLLDTTVDASEAEPADLVIAMENLVRHDTPLVRALRRKGDPWAPFVSLIVPRTVEHIERCLSPELSEREVARTLVSGIYQFRNDAGRMEPGQQPTKEAAVALGRYLTQTDRSAPWPITALTLLEVSDSQEESDLYAESIVSNRAGTKRSREPEDAVNTVDQSKRARTEPQRSTAQADVTYVSDLLNDSTQSEEKSSAPTAREERLSTLLMDAQQREAEHKQALDDLQYRHEDQRNKLLEVTGERDRAIMTAQTAVTRFAENQTSMTALRAKRSELEAELKEAQERLLEHPIPERADFEALRVVAAQARADKEKIEAKLQRTEKDLEYVRGKYQSASSAGQELATQNTDLENQVAVLKNKAMGEQVKLRELYLDDVTKNLRNENKKLKAMMKDRETAIKFRDDEILRLKEASRGRMGTRNTSVPRTPRVGSRQSSPAAGELRNTMLHPLRNAQGS